MKCPKCSFDNLTEAKFCCQCGTSLAPKSYAPIKCPQCGTVNTSNSVFCISCGTGLTPTQPQPQPNKTPTQSHTPTPTTQSNQSRPTRLTRLIRSTQTQQTPTQTQTEHTTPKTPPIHKSQVSKPSQDEISLIVTQLKSARRVRLIMLILTITFGILLSFFIAASSIAKRTRYHDLYPIDEPAYEQQVEVEEAACEEPVEVEEAACEEVAISYDYQCASQVEAVCEDCGVVEVSDYETPYNEQQWSDETQCVVSVPDSTVVMPEPFPARPQSYFCIMCIPIFALLTGIFLTLTIVFNNKAKRLSRRYQEYTQLTI